MTTQKRMTLVFA